MIKDPHVFLKHILESIVWIEKDVRGLSKEEFLLNVPIQDAVIRRIEIIGEAVRNIPTDTRRAYPYIPWQNISGMRDKLIHGYFGVDLELVWEVVKKDIPPLEEQIKEIVE